MTEAAHRVDEAGDLEHDERKALRADVERVREVLTSTDIASNGSRAVAVYACGPADLLEIVSLRRPIESARRARALAARRAAGGRRRRRALVRRARQPPQRPHLPGRRRRPGGDRARRGRRAQPARPGRLVAGALPARRREGEGRPPRAGRRRRVRRVQGRRLRPPARRRAGRARRRVRGASCTRTCASASPAACTSTSTTRRSTTCAARRARRSRTGRAAASARRSTAWPRASAAAGAGRPACRDVLGALNEARVETLLLTEALGASGHRDRETGMLYAGGEASGGRDRRGLRGHRRAGDREGDRAVGQGGDGPSPRRPRAARRDRRRAALLMEIALLGTGTMGAPMGRRLLAAGHGLRAWNRTRSRAEPLAAEGAAVLDTPAEAVAGADVVVTMLADARRGRGRGRRAGARRRRRGRR